MSGSAGHLATFVLVLPGWLGPDSSITLCLQPGLRVGNRLPCCLCSGKCPNVALHASLRTRRLVVGATLKLAAGGLRDASRQAFADLLLLARRAISRRVCGSACGCARRATGHLCNTAGAPAGYIIPLDKPASVGQMLDKPASVDQMLDKPASVGQMLDKVR